MPACFARLWLGQQVHIRSQMPSANLDQVITLAPQRPRDGPVSLNSHMDDTDPDAQILGFGHDLGHILVTTDQHGLAQLSTARERGQVTLDVAFDAFPATGSNPGRPELEPRDISDTVLFLVVALVDGGLIPVAAQQRQPGSVPCDLAQQPDQAGIVPRDGVTVARSVHRHRAVGQEIAGVYEQRTAIHPTPPLPSNVRIVGRRSALAFEMSALQFLGKPEASRTTPPLVRGHLATPAPCAPVHLAANQRTGERILGRTQSTDELRVTHSYHCRTSTDQP